MKNQEYGYFILIKVSLCIYKQNTLIHRSVAFGSSKLSSFLTQLEVEGTGLKYAFAQSATPANLCLILRAVRIVNLLGLGSL